MFNKISKASAFAMALTLGSMTASLPLAAFAGSLPNARVKADTVASGQLVVTGSATVNGKKALTGTTVYPDSRIEVACTPGSNVTLNLGSLGRIQLGVGSAMVVRFSDSQISGELFAGKAIVNNNAGVKVSVTTPEGVSAADGKEAAALSINTQKGTRCAPMVAKGGKGGGGGSIGAGGVAAIVAGAAGATAIGVAATNGDNNNRNRNVSTFRIN